MELYFLKVFHFSKHLMNLSLALLFTNILKDVLETRRLNVYWMNKDVIRSNNKLDSSTRCETTSLGWAALSEENSLMNQVKYEIKRFHADFFYSCRLWCRAAAIVGLKRRKMCRYTFREVFFRIILSSIYYWIRHLPEMNEIGILEKNFWRQSCTFI